MKRIGLSSISKGFGRTFPVNTTPIDWHKPTGSRTTRIGGGYYNYRRHAYVRR